jgi:hypothetical protein
MRRAFVVALAFATRSFASPLVAEDPSGLPLSGAEAETFLRTATVVKKRGLDTGITHSDQYTLSDGTSTHRAVFKTIDQFKRGVTQLERGEILVDFADSYKFEIAAYELDKLIGLALVPPTVERRFGSRTGSLQLWVEGAMTEADRKQKGLSSPDRASWNQQMYKVRLFHQLTYNTDSRNIRNVLLDTSFRVYAIDSSRAFAPSPYLRAEDELARFSRSVLERLGTLDKPTLEGKLGRWLSGLQIDTLLTRRDRIVALARKRVAERGEAEVLDP